MELFEKSAGVQTRWFSPENPKGEPGRGGLENRGSKGRPCLKLPHGASVDLMDVEGSGMVTRIWVTINDRSPEMLRGLRLDMFWDGAETPAVSAPFGDFFGVGLGRRTPFECALFSDPEGRSFNCMIPMPFRTGGRITLTNESGRDLPLLFYDVDVLMNVEHSPETLYFHAHWRRESPNALGEEYVILPFLEGSGRFLGCNIGVITDARYEGTWWGEGEVKVRIGGEASPTLCGTGTEDYIGTGWGQGKYLHRLQGCTIADKDRRHWAFYRYHVDDPVFFDGSVSVAIQTIGGGPKPQVMGMIERGIPLIPSTVDSEAGTMVHLRTLPEPVHLEDHGAETGWCNFWRQDDWSSVAYFYLDRPQGVLPPIAAPEDRIAGLSVEGDPSARADA